MTPALKTATEKLYASFSSYPLRPTISGCPCCVTEADQQKLRSKQLTELESDDISRYAFKAMTTWGDEDDFKHFLPRLLELLSTTGIAYENEVLLRKLSYAKWENWNHSEKDAVKDFVLAWWSELTAKNNNELNIITDMSSLLGEIDPLLQRWNLDLDGPGFRNLIGFIHTHYYDVQAQKARFKDLDPASVQKLRNWLQEKKGVLEDAYFHFESKDSSFAEDISKALSMLEWAP